MCNNFTTARLCYYDCKINKDKMCIQTLGVQRRRVIMTKTEARAFAEMSKMSTIILAKFDLFSVNIRSAVATEPYELFE